MAQKSKTLFEILDSNPGGVLLDTSIFFTGYNFLRISDYTYLPTKKLYEVSLFHQKLQGHIASRKALVTQGVISEMEKSRGKTKRFRYIRDELLATSISFERQIIVGNLLQHYINLKEEVRNALPIKDFQFSKLMELLDAVNKESKSSRNSSQLSHKSISEVDLCLFLTAYTNSIPLISWDTDMLYINDWLKRNVEPNPNFKFYRPVYNGPDELEGKLYELE